MFHCNDCLNNEPDFKIQFDEMGEEICVCECGAENSIVMIQAQDAHEPWDDGPGAA